MKRGVNPKLVKYFQRNGYFRVPDKERRKKEGQNYKKGYEVRLVANNENELRNIRKLLKKDGFKVANSFKKNKQFVQPLYGKKSFKSFLSSVDTVDLTEFDNIDT